MSPAQPDSAELAPTGPPITTAAASSALSTAGDAATLAACASRLVSVAPLLMREFRAEMRRSAPPDLSVPLFRALILASSRPGATISDLANHLGVTLPTASVAVAKLGARGLLCPAEPGQRPRLLLTPAGAELVHRARDDATRAFERRLAGLPADALLQIDGALVALESALSAGPRGGRACPPSFPQRPAQASGASEPDAAPRARPPIPEIAP